MKEKVITPEEEYNDILKKRTKEELERAKRHNCDGICYCSQFMCPAVETCEETRTGEFFATILAVLTIILSPILIYILMILL